MLSLRAIDIRKLNIGLRVLFLNEDRLFIRSDCFVHFSQLEGYLS